jgi:hypothetical protein
MAGAIFYTLDLYQPPRASQALTEGSCATISGNERFEGIHPKGRVRLGEDILRRMQVARTVHTLGRWTKIHRLGSTFRRQASPG